MLDKQPHRIRALAHQPQRLVDDIEVIQRIVIANHRAQVRAVAPDHPVTLPRLTHEGFREQPAAAVGAVEQVATAVGLARLQGAGPRVIAHAVDLFRPVPAPGVGQALWITLIEQRHAGAGQRWCEAWISTGSFGPR
jgi:hypothetical protein